MAIRIPESQRKDLKSLLGLDAELFDRLISGLEAVRPAASARLLAASVAQAVGLTEAELLGVVRAAISLYVTRDRVSIQSESLIQDVLKQAVELGYIPATDEVALRQAQERLLRLLALHGSIGITAKAADLATEAPLPFEDARVLTDVRPIFSPGDQLTPAAALVLHSLKIVAHGEEGHSAKFYALSGKELRQLRDVIDRALKKEAALKATLDKAGVPIVDVDFD